MMGSVLLRVAFQLVAILESPHLSLSLFRDRFLLSS